MAQSGCCAVEVAIRIDHLGFHPEAEIHAEAVDVVDQRGQAVGEFLGIHGPIAQAGVVVVARAEPAIVHHEALHAQFRGLVGERLLSRLIDGELGGFPRVVEHRAQARRSAARHYVSRSKRCSMRDASPKPPSRVARVKGRRLQGFAGRQRIAEIEGIETARDAHLLVRGLFDGQPPVPAPADGAEPHPAALFVGAPFVDGEPWIGLVRGVAAAALDHLHTGVDRFLVDLPLARPAAGQVGEAVPFATGQSSMCRIARFRASAGPWCD